MILNKFLQGGFLLLLCFLLFKCKNNTISKLSIATAANMQFAMEEIIASFEEETDIECEMIVSSSGKLTAQIQEGAPFDLLVSADLKYPKSLFESGLTIEKPSIYAYGKLVLWSATPMKTLSLENLQNPNYQHIAIANPKIAPYGLAAAEVLEHYSLLKTIEDKLVYGESIAQTNQFILSGAAPLGFTAKSVVLSPELKNKGTWIELSDSTYRPIQQAVVMLKTNPEKAEHIRQFHAYLFSPKSQQILEQFGYGLTTK
ncbi:MAG: molybdate ABC transporter substrate-binding protein [Bacteroidota bacterium]